MLGGVEQWLRARPLAVDLALMAGLLVLVLGLRPLGAGSSPGAVWVLADAALISTLALRRVSPVVSFASLSALLAVQVLMTSRVLAGDFALLVGLYSIAAYGPVWARWCGLATGLLGAVLATWRFWVSTSGLPWSEYGGTLAGLAGAVLAAWTLGSLRRTRQAYVDGLEERAHQAERVAAQQARIGAAAERARIAREMHDVVAHSLSVIVVQADGALYASSTRPQAATEALATISTTGRDSLTQMRRLLGLLHADDDAPVGSTAGSTAAERAPMPSARDLGALVAQVRDSGVAVELQVDGAVERVDDASGLTVYRIVQEALTNTLRHGGDGVSARVGVQVGDDWVEVLVQDDGRGAAALGDGAGHGLRGMRQRIAVHDGQVHAGPRPGGGFEVRAVVPYTGVEVS